MPFRVLFLLATLAFGLLAPAAARAQVEATLVALKSTFPADSAKITVGIRLDHQPKWHSYWLQPGTGFPTTVKWQLPAGWTAGPIRWPAPHRVFDTAGNLAGNGYEGVTYLPVELTPPADLAPGPPVTLRAEIKWLMCKDVCVPGSADATLTLTPVAPGAITTANVTDSPAGEGLLATLEALPTPLPADWQADVVRTGPKSVRLSFLSASAPRGEPWYFDAQAAIDYEKPQPVSTAGDRTVLELTIPDYADPARLTGVLTFKNGPAHDLDLPITDAPASGLTFGVTRATPAAAVPVTSLVGTLALAFIGGLILNLMPCVFPVLGIKILGFVNQAGSDRRKVTLHGLAFAGGVLVSFWVLAGVLAVLRAGGDQLGWGFQLQSPGFVFILAAVMLVFALSMSGVFEFGLRATAVGSGLQSKDGLAGSFFTGVLATVVATPCSAPFLAPALGAALALPVVESFAVFTAIASGLALPYLLLSLFPQAVKALPRPGAWMETFKQAMAFPLYATVGYLVWVLAGQLGDNDTALLSILLGLTLIAFATWLYGRYATFGATPTRARIGLLGGLLALAAGAWLGWPRPAAPTDIVWQPWSAEAVAEAVADNKIIYVDFTARWCFTCQTNKKVVFGSSEVLKTFREKEVVTLRADWTDEDPAITAELARWNRSAVPFNLIYLPGVPDPVILPELLTPGIVLDALQ
jgi:thiol:disulfide interchange protein DsbD